MNPKIRQHVDECVQPCRVLHVIGAMDRGGAETFIMNVYRSMDRSLVQFDFLVHEQRKCDYDDEILNLGGRLYRLPRFTGANLSSYIRSCRNFFMRHHDFRAVHVHIGSCAAIVLHEARKYGQYTIAHSHATNSPDFSFAEMFYRVFSFPTRYLADQYLACSMQAGVDRFGSKIVECGHFAVVENGIDTAQYRFNATTRSALRKSLGVNQNETLFSHVGRFAEEKNHAFLIDIFNRIKLIHSDSKLVLVGRGPLEREIRQKVHDCGLSDSVYFLGVRKDVPAILMASDAFLFPSKYEGFGIAALEAQATGLPCLLSDALPEAIRVLPNCSFMSLNKSSEIWADEILNNISSASSYSRIMASDMVSQKGYDIKRTSVSLTNLYLYGQLGSKM